MKELESLEALTKYLEQFRSLENVVLQGINLEDFDLSQVAMGGAVFLGCRMRDEQLSQATRAGALVFPAFATGPYKPFRAGLYSPEELYDGFRPEEPESYAESFDARVYQHWLKSGRAEPSSILETLARRIHDHGITDALTEVLEDRRIVAIMGGHSVMRDAPQYLTVARIAKKLTEAGFFMVSGGGPGAMEATHVGAWFAGRTEPELASAVEILAKAPSYMDREWLSRAFEVRQAYPLRDAKYESLGIPTWLYGHEPPNPFATLVAKYFANSVREDGLLAIAKHGVVFTPGSAGTIQEIFQDACQNHYNTQGVVSPMIFLGERFWTVEKPVYPLLEHLAQGQDYAKWMLLTDAEEAVVEHLQSFARA